MIRALRLAPLATACLLATQACGARNDQVAENLVVDWSIDGVDSEQLCGTYGIDLWTVEIRGPEDLSFDVDCRDDLWTTGDEMVGPGALLLGAYRVTVTAIDELEDEIVTQEAATIVLDERDRVLDNSILFDFSGADL